MVEYLPGGLIKSSDTIRKYRNVGITALCAIIAASAFRKEIIGVIVDGLVNIQWYHAVLYIATILFTIDWIWSTWYELDKVLSKWLHSPGYVPPSDFLESLYVFFYVIFIGLLYFTIKNISVYCWIFAIYSLFNLFIGGFHFLTELADVVYISERCLDECENKKNDNALCEKTQACRIAVSAIRLYWVNNLDTTKRHDKDKKQWVIESWKNFFDNRYFMRLLAVLIGSFIALIPAIIYEYYQLEWLQIFSYLLIAAVIIVSEIWIDVWRVQRDRTIRQAARKWDPELQQEK